MAFTMIPNEIMAPVPTRHFTRRCWPAKGIAPWSEATFRNGSPRGRIGEDFGTVSLCHIAAWKEAELRTATTKPSWTTSWPGRATGDVAISPAARCGGWFSLWVPWPA